MDRTAQLRRFADRQGDQVVECAMAELLEDDDLGRHARRVRRIYRTRRDTLVTLLGDQLGNVLSFETPPGGMAIWVRVSSDIDVRAWCARALARGVQVKHAGAYRFDGRYRPQLRLSFAAHNEDELKRAVLVLRATCP